MKLRILSTAVFCAMLLAVAPAARADQVRSDWNHKVDFSRYHTYSWGKVKVSNPFDADRIKNAVQDALRQKGWQEVPSGGQVIVNVVDQIHNEKQAETYYNGLGGGWGMGWGWGGWGWGNSGPGGFGESQTNVRNVPEGHMIIDLFDSQNKQLIWRGISEGEVKSNPDKEQKTLQDDIHKLFEDFPPKAK